jgi:hypothetical protein
MALQLGTLRDALTEAGATPEMAEAAAEEVAGYGRGFADVRADLRVLKWGQAVTFAVLIAVLLRLFIQ